MPNDGPDRRCQAVHVRRTWRRQHTPSASHRAPRSPILHLHPHSLPGDLGSQPRVSSTKCAGRERCRDLWWALARGRWGVAGDLVPGPNLGDPGPNAGRAIQAGVRPEFAPLPRTMITMPEVDRRHKLSPGAEARPSAADVRSHRSRSGKGLAAGRPRTARGAPPTPWAAPLTRRALMKARRVRSPESSGGLGSDEYFQGRIS